MLNRPSPSRKRIREIDDLPKKWIKALWRSSGSRVSAQLRSDAYFAYLDGRTEQSRKFHKYADVIDAEIKKGKLS